MDFVNVYYEDCKGELVMVEYKADPSEMLSIDSVMRELGCRVKQELETLGRRVYVMA